MQFSSREPGAPVPQGEIPLCVPYLGGNEWSYVKECLDTNFVSSVGPFVTRFEQSIAAHAGVPFAVATVNGTAALHIALMVAGVKAGDEVLVSTLTFIAPVNAIRYVGAFPVFVDAEPEYWEMDVDKAIDFLNNRCSWRDGALYNKSTGRRIRAIVPVHILGHPVDMDRLVEIAHRFDLAIIEDATESLGATYRDRPVGSIGDIACFSFNGNKLITTGGGGMIVTSNEMFARRARYLTTQAKDDAIEFVHGEVGYNYRLTNIAAAVGLAQMERLNDHLDAKRTLAATYRNAFDADACITPMREAEWAWSAHWLFTVLVDPVSFEGGSRGVMRGLAELGIQTRPLWQPCHLSPAHAGAERTDCSVAEYLNSVALSLPSSVGLTASEQARVISSLSSLRRTASERTA